MESNVHFPTDYNLLWDSARKCLDMIKKILETNSELKGWRKLKEWRRILKNGSRAVGRACSSRGKHKEKMVKKAVADYLEKARRLSSKLDEDMKNLSEKVISEKKYLLMLKYFKEMTDKHISLLDRRILKGETIPHSEKVFSIFENYTEWINKGKLHPSVELGKKILVTTDSNNLIIDYQVMEKTADSDAVPELLERIISMNININSWSFDKGFYSKENKKLLLEKVENLVMPKKGKKNIVETEEEHKSSYRNIRMRHSAIESNINELENCGLDRCPDRGYENFKRYVGLGVTSYNLKKIGRKLLEDENLSKNKKSA